MREIPPRFYHYKAAFISLFAGLCVPFAAQAQTLDEVLSLVYATNPDLRAGQADFRSTAEQVPLAKAQGRPQIGGSVSYETQDGEYDPGQEIDFSGTGLDDVSGLLSVLTGNAGFGTTSAGIQLTQPLFQGFRVKNSVQQAKAAVKASQANLAGLEQQVFARTIQAYLGVVSAEQAYEVAQSSVAVLERQKQAADSQFDLGQNTRTDTARIDAAKEQAKASMINAQADLMVARASFTAIVGQAPGTLETDPNMPVLPASQEALLEAALLSNPSLETAKHAEQAALKAVRVAEGALAPSISAVASYGIARDTYIQGDEAKSATLTAQMTVPLYQGGAEYARVRQAKAQLAASRQRRLAANRAVREAVTTVWLRHQAAQAGKVAADRTVAAAELAFASVQEEQRLGQRSSLDVIIAEQSMFEARLHQVTARQQEQLTAYAILQVAGQLTAQGLALNVAEFDSEAVREQANDRWFGLE